LISLCQFIAYFIQIKLEEVLTRFGIVFGLTFTQPEVKLKQKEKLKKCTLCYKYWTLETVNSK
jgi:hypothetical protein